MTITLACRQLDVSIASVQVVQQLELEIHSGSFWAMLGPNGVGKTTLLNCLAGLRAADHGEVKLRGRAIQSMPRRQLARQLGMLQQHSAYVFDSSVLQTALTGRHPHLGLLEREGPADFDLARSALNSVDLQDFEDRCVTTLSGGEARRLAFASLLVQQASVMLLDEPSNHLDLKHQVQIMQMIRGLSVQQDGIAIAALHDVNLAMSYCSHALLLLGSGKWQAGPVGEMLTEANLERTFGCPVEALQGKNGLRFYPLTNP
ncbi:MAG: ABC transporter ATP-binding protein [Xanthomonadales bacterium]|nr:ABC transporter ATP-binding protein [Xanthomonadales bacterium]